MLSPTQKAYMRKEESSPTVMWAPPISSPPLYSTESTIRFPESPVCEGGNTQVRWEVKTQTADSKTTAWTPSCI